MVFGSRIKPENVFTPKGKFVNEEMYIHRPTLETAFKKSLRKPKHIIIHGESGCGKTWLYKKLLKEWKVEFEVLNAATISSTGKIADAVKTLTSRLVPYEKSSYEESKSATANAAVAKGELKHTSKYESSILDPYLELVKALFKKAHNNRSFLVIDNLEHIVRNEDLVKELSSLILYLDDVEYAKYNVRIILVGTTSNIRDYFARADSSQTIINRVQEIPEVSVLTNKETESLAIKGLFDLLRINCVDDKRSGFNKNYLLNAISWFSTNVPQYVHEICLDLAIEAEENNYQITNEIYVESLRNWVQEALVSENTRMESHINSKATRHGRRNQVIYTIGSLNTNEFSAHEVEEKLRENFPGSTEGKTLNISSNLKELSSGKSPLIRKTPKGNRYRFLDPKIKIMARWMLDKTDKETIEVKKFDESIKF